MTNSGANQAGPGTVAVTLPKGFTAVIPVTNCSGTGQPLTVMTCTFTSIAGGGATAAFTFPGTFNDTGLNSDAVAPPLTTAGVPTPATVAGSAINGTVTATVPAGGIVLTGIGTYAPPSAATSDTITVTRVNILAYTLGSGSLPNNTLNELNTANLNDTVTYTATITNSGASVARGLLFTIPVPSASTIAVSGITISNGAASVPNQLTCTPSPYTSGTPALTCYENDLNTPAATATTTPATLTYTVSFTATFNEMTVPQTTVTGKVTVTQGAGTFYAASVSPSSANYETATPGSPNPTPITVQRSTHLNQTLSIAPAPGQAAPATYTDRTDLNLDEHILNNAPGANDTLLIVATTDNTGPNDAAGVSIIVPLPQYLELFAPVASCSITGVPSPTFPYITGAWRVADLHAPGDALLGRIGRHARTGFVLPERGRATRPRPVPP